MMRFLGFVRGIYVPKLMIVAIGLRVPYKEVSNSVVPRWKMSLDVSEYGTGYHQAVASNVSANLGSIGIDEDEIIFDQSQSLPYKLHPYVDTGEHTDGYADTVFIYEPKTKVMEPIEKKSKIVGAIAQHFRIDRIFVAAEKKKTLENYLEKNFGSY